MATINFWNGYARWYKVWMEHTRYHERVIEVLLAMTEPGWRVLDIGSGNKINQELRTSTILHILLMAAPLVVTSVKERTYTMDD